MTVKEAEKKLERVKRQFKVLEHKLWQAKFNITKAEENLKKTVWVKKVRKSKCIKCKRMLARDKSAMTDGRYEKTHTGFICSRCVYIPTPCSRHGNLYCACEDR
jgi:hypothetical protein